MYQKGISDWRVTGNDNGYWPPLVMELNNDPNSTSKSNITKDIFFAFNKFEKHDERLLYIQSVYIYIAFK